MSIEQVMIWIALRNMTVSSSSTNYRQSCTYRIFILLDRFISSSKWPLLTRMWQSVPSWTLTKHYISGQANGMYHYVNLSFTVFCIWQLLLSYVWLWYVMNVTFVPLLSIAIWSDMLWMLLLCHYSVLLSGVVIHWYCLDQETYWQ